ncbi:algG [Acrasis kona]|uniref:AlgG n=1 Tax=Acrasis kona TaxID=1008807 RepID=A0AAW2YIP8_9EUKA
MTYESLSDLVEEHCSRIGFLIANVDSQTLTNHIQQIASSTFINVAGHQKLCTVSDRTTVLDSLDMGVLLPIVKSNHVGPLSSNTNISLSLPQDYSGYNLSTSAIPWPLFDEFISIKDPSEIQWVEHCNKPHIASLRILLRGTVAQCQASRQFVLSASSKDIGFFLASALLDTMSDLASKRSQVPTSQEFDDATCQMMRCLFGFLFTLLGSGATPLSMAWQLVMKNPQLEVPPSGDHWWLYSSIIRLFPYTGWSCRYLHQNVYSLIAKTMRKVVTDPVTEPLRKQLTVINEKVEKNYLERRNAELKFLRVAIQVIQFLDQNKKSSNSMLVDKDYKEITSRLSTLVPHQNDKKKKTGYDIVVEYVLLQSKGSKISDKLYDRVLVVSHNIIAKRSAIYKDHKKKIAKAIKSQKNCSKIALDIINKANEISDKWSGTSPRVQNLNLLQKVSKDEVDDSCKALIGDAEVSRSPWLVSDAQVEEDHSNVEALVQFVLNNTSISKEMQVKTVAVQKQVGWIAELKEHPNSKNAVALAERIKSLNVENVAELMKINKPYLDVLLGVVGDEHVLDKLKTMIEVLIKGWRDTNSAEVEAKNVLK